MTTTQTKTPVQLAEAVIATFNAADWDQIRATIAPNVVYTETGTQRRVENLYSKQIENRDFCKGVPLRAPARGRPYKNPPFILT